MNFLEFYKSLPESQQQEIRRKSGIKPTMWSQLINGTRGYGGKETGAKLLCADDRITLQMLWPDEKLPDKYR